MSRQSNVGRLLAGASLLVVALLCGNAVQAQTRDNEGLRGTGTNVSDDSLVPPSGTAPRSGGRLSGATPSTSPEKASLVDLTAPNYGKPRKRADPRKKYAGQPQQTGRLLPPLQPYASPAAARQQRATPLRTQAPGPTVASIPTIPARSRPQVEADPWAPIGVPVGSLRLVPYLDMQGGYDTNPDRTNTPGKGSQTLRGEVGAAWKSDWSVHEFKGDVKAGYTKYFDAPLASRPDAQGKLNLRLDASRDTALDFELRGQLDTQRPGSTELTPTGLKGRPLVTSLGATAGANHRIGNLELGLHGTLDRTIYEDATLNNGTKLVLGGNSFNTYGLRGRVGYQVTPGITPFAEISSDLRRHDETIDSAGFSRDSAGVGAKLGSTFEVSRALTGEAAVGYAQRRYADTRLPLLAGATVDAALVWTVSPLTSVSLRGATTLSETTVANASGAVNRTMSLDISHALLRNLTIGAVGTIGVNDYKGINLHENTYAGTLRAEYRINRSLAVRGSFTHERLRSSAPGSDYTANVFLLGLKLQR